VDSTELRFTELFHAHYGAVYRYALRRSDHQMADEVAAETLTIAWRKLHDVPSGEARARAWLLAVARRVLANTARSGRRAALLSERLNAQPPPAAPDIADTVAERHQVFSVLSHLAERDQEAMKLIGWDGLSVAQAATVLGCSRGALAVRLHRARRSIHHILHDGEPAEAASAAPGAITTQGNQAHA
jgi:RNA polymerase sigma-70 factor (ECF subfamily)